MKLYLGSSVWREQHMEHAASMRNLYFHLYQNGISFIDEPMVGDAMITRARSRAASFFLRTDADVLITIDSDISFQPKDVVKIAEAALVQDAIVGGIYMKRGQEMPSPASQLPIDGTPVVFAEGQPLVEISYLSSGFMAVPRVVLEKLTPTMPLVHQHAKTESFDGSYWPFYMEMLAEQSGQTLHLSEDWAFCERAKQAGFKVLLDPTIRLTHWGTYGYTLEDAVRAARPKLMPIMMRMSEGPKGMEISVPEEQIEKEPTPDWHEHLPPKYEDYPAMKQKVQG